MDRNIIDKDSGSLELRRLVKEDLKALLDLQGFVYDALKDKDQFVYTSEDECLESILKDVCLGVFDGKTMAAAAVIVTNRDSERNLGKKMGFSPKDCLTLDTVFVAPEYRGLGLQRQLIEKSLELGAEIKADKAFATVSPENDVSLENFRAMGFEVFRRDTMYGGFDRYILMKKLNSREVTLIIAADRHEKYSRFDDFTDKPESSLPGLLSLVKDDGVKAPDAVLLGGDYVGRFGAGGNFPFSFADLDEEIASVYGEGKVPAFCTYGSHDKMRYKGSWKDYPGVPEEFSYEGFLSGPERRDGYYLYGISFSQVNFDTDQNAQEEILKREQKGREPELDFSDPNGISAESATEKFLNWIDSLNDHDPIVIASHMPLHYNKVRNDNLGAYIWVNALNRASENHDIFIAWGHNHTVEERYERGETQMASIDDRECYLALPGRKIEVPTGEKEYLFEPDGSPVLNRRGDHAFNVSHKEMEIKFTYMNAGYLKLGYCNTITFTGDGESFSEAEIKRYSLHLNENCDLKDFGTSGYKSPIKLKLKR